MNSNFTFFFKWHSLFFRYGFLAVGFWVSRFLAVVDFSMVCIDFTMVLNALWLVFGFRRFPQGFHRFVDVFIALPKFFVDVLVAFIFSMVSTDSGMVLD